METICICANIFYSAAVNKTNPVNILFLLEDLCYGGTQKQTLELASRLDADRFYASILTLTGPTDLDQLALDRHLPPYYLGVNRKVPRLFPFRLGKALRQLKPDILVACTALPNIWGRIWGQLLRIPVIIGTCRGGGAIERQHEKLLWRLADHLVCNSRPLASRLEEKGVPATEITFIPNAVDTDLFHPAQNRKSGGRILCVARLAEDKDHKTLLDAFAIVARSDPNARLVLVGEGPEEKNLKKHATSLPQNCRGRIEFCGADGDTAKYYANADVFCLSSIREGQPNAIMEAMACGLPVAATSVGGIPELVENEKSGLLSPAGDADALAQNILKILQNPEMAAAMGARGREIAEKNFSFSAMIGAHENLFDSLWQNYLARKGKNKSRN